MKFLLLPKGVVTLTGGSLIWFWKWSLEIINEMKDNLLFVIVFCQFFPFQSLLLWLHFFFTVKHIYLPSLKILYQPNGGDLRVPPRRSNIFVHCHVCCTHHWVAKQVNKVSPHYTFSILPLKPWRASHRFDLRFFFSPAWAPLTRFWFKMFDRLAGNLESSVSFFC